MPFFDGSDCMSAWNIPISHAVPSSTNGPSRIASIASARSIPGRSCAKIHAGVTRSPSVASSYSCGTKTSNPSARSAAEHLSMNERSYGVKSGPAK
jgi:hypothetical protein